MQLTLLIKELISEKVRLIETHSRLGKKKKTRALLLIISVANPLRTPIENSLCIYQINNLQYHTDSF